PRDHLSDHLGPAQHRLSPASVGLCKWPRHRALARLLIVVQHATNPRAEVFAERSRPHERMADAFGRRDLDRGMMEVQEFVRLVVRIWSGRHAPTEDLVLLAPVFVDVRWRLLPRREAIFRPEVVTRARSPRCEVRADDQQSRYDA